MTVLTYLVMLVALSMVFVGIKQYRDQALGGVIKFGPALLVGLGISAVRGCSTRSPGRSARRS